MGPAGVTRYEARRLTVPRGTEAYGVYRVAPDGVAALLATGSRAECQRLARLLNDREGGRARERWAC